MMRQRFSGDRGQVATAVMMIVSIAVVAVVVLGVLRLGGAVDARGQSQTAADAAALAGAGAVRDELVGILTGLPSKHAFFNALGCGLGHSDASSFAARNDARVVRYCYHPAADEIRVTVENRRAGEAGPARSCATAALGLPLGACRFEDEERPTPSPRHTEDGDEDDESEPSEDPDLGTELRCGPLTVRFLVKGGDGRLALLTPPGQLRSELDRLLVPRLVR
jgi:hypothetical protein